MGLGRKHWSVVFHLSFALGRSPDRARRGIHSSYCLTNRSATWMQSSGGVAGSGPSFLTIFVFALCRRFGWSVAP